MLKERPKFAELGMVAGSLLRGLLKRASHELEMLPR